MKDFIALDTNGNSEQANTRDGAFNIFLNNHSASPDYIFTKLEILRAVKRMTDYQAKEVWKK